MLILIEFMESGIGRGWRVRQLADDEVIEGFSCGDSDLDDYILNESKLYQAELIAANYLLEDEQRRLIAFFTLVNDRVCINDFDTYTAFNRFRNKRFVQSKRFRGYPALKVGRLGVTKDFIRSGIGSILLDFIKTYFIKNRRTGCRFLTVDAYQDAVPFYDKNGFVKLNEESNSNTCLMYYDLLDFRGRL